MRFYNIFAQGPDYARNQAEAREPEWWDGLWSAYIPTLSGWHGGTIPDLGSRRGAITGYSVSYWGQPGRTADTWQMGRCLTLPTGSAPAFQVMPTSQGLSALSVVALFQVGYSATGLATGDILSDYGSTPEGWRFRIINPSSGVAKLIFPITTALDSADTTNGLVIPAAGNWVVAVGRYDGQQTITIDAWCPQTGNQHYQWTKTLTNGGPIYYTATGHTTYALSGGGGAGLNYYGALLYNRDIGPAMAAKFGLRGADNPCDSVLAPFIPASRTQHTYLWNPSTSYNGVAADTLVPSDNAAASKVMSVGATDVLALTDAAYRVATGGEAANSLSASDAADVLASHRESATSTATLSGSADLTAVRVPQSTSVLALADIPLYIGPHPASANTVLALTDTAYRCQTLLASATTPLALLAIAIASGTVHAAATNTLSLLSLADEHEYRRTAATQISLIDTASADHCYTASSALVLADVAAEGQINARATSALALISSGRSNPLQYSAVDVLELTDWIGTSIKMLEAQTELALVDANVVQRPWYVASTDNLATPTFVYDPDTMLVATELDGLQDAAIVAHTYATPLSNHDYLQWQSVASVVWYKVGAIDLSAIDVLELDYDVNVNQVGPALSLLQLTDVAHVDQCVPLVDTLELSDLATPCVVRAFSVIDALDLSQSLAFTANGSNYRFQYHPFVGEGPAGAPSTTLAAPMDGITVPFQLVYPAEGTVTDSCTLRAPNLGNKDRLSFQRISRETRGGTLIVYADPMWPKIQTLVLTFSALRRDEAQGLLSFFENYLGQEVGLIDWEQRYWKGIIVSPEDPVVEDLFNSYSASFQFEGELATWLPQSIPAPAGTQPPRSVDTYRSGALSPTNEPVMEAYTAMSDDLVLTGQPLYVKSSGNVGLAQANTSSTATVVGFATSSAAPTTAVEYTTEGMLTLSDWTVMAGTPSLMPGSAYYLNAATPGQITATVPTDSGYVVRIGLATSAQTLDIEIESPIRL